MNKSLSKSKIRQTARSLLECAEETMIRDKTFVTKYEPLEFSGDRFRRTAFKLAYLNAETIISWKNPSECRDTKMDVVDMFCGCGGVSVGFSALNRFVPAYRLAGALDIDPYSCETYERNLGVKPHRKDINDLIEKKGDLDFFMQSCGIDGKRPLVLIGCPPCQGFSSHRKKDWHKTDHRNDLVESFATVASLISPDFIFMENVPELLSEKYRAHFESFRKILEGAGYRVSATVVNMARFGVPQERHRAIVFAARKPSAIPEGYLPENTFNTVRQAISGLEPISPEHPNQADPMHITARHRESTLSIIRQVPQNGGSRPRGVGPPCLDRVKGFYDVYGRLYWDKPAITITAYARNPASGRYTHPQQNRGLSVREAALLQSFPQTYSFMGPFDDKFSQVGNAVPPRFSSFASAFILGELASDFTAETGIQEPISNSYSSKIAVTKMLRNKGCGPTPTAVDAFCGAGGLSLGLSRSGFKLLLAYDSDPKAVDTYRNNLGGHVILADAHQINVNAELRKKGYDPEDLVLVAGGPPCQGFSIQRRGEDEDPRNSLVMLFFQQAINMCPRFILMENVLGINGKRGKGLLDEINQICRKANYYCHSRILNAAEFGVPQIRKRMFIVAERNNGNGLFFEFPSPPFSEESWKNVWEAISDLPPPPENGKQHSSIPNHRCDKLTERNKERFSYVKPSGGRDQIPAEFRLPCHSVDANTAGHRYVYGRLDFLRPAGVITARFDSLTRGRFGHPKENRTISLREGARLQSFPDSFIFTGNKTDVARQIGNAVPPLLADVMGMAVIDAWKRQCNGKPPRKKT